MSLRAERALIGLLPDRDSLEVLMREGIPLDIVPTDGLDEVITWSLDYLTRSAKSPTPEVLRERFGDLLEDLEIDLDDEPEESIEWALETLKSTYVRKKSGEFARDFATAIADATPEERLDVMGDFSSTLAALVGDLTPRHSRVDFRESAERMLASYDLLANDPGAIRGMSMGLPQVDEHYKGIRDGEICIIAAPAKMGKSHMLNHATLREWERGRSVALVTLENSIEMTQHRIACMARGLSLQDLEAGQLDESDRRELGEWVHDVLIPSETPMHILQPPTGQRTPHALVQAAMALDADSLIIDQLTFVEPSRRRRDQSRVYELAEIMRDFKNLVGGGRRKLPLMMAHQINREGIKNAKKTGWLSMSDMADSSEIERASDFVFGLYASDDMRRTGGMQLQSLAARRVPGQSYDLHWHVGVGAIGVRNTVSDLT